METIFRKMAADMLRVQMGYLKACKPFFRLNSFIPKEDKAVDYYDMANDRRWDGRNE